MLKKIAYLASLFAIAGIAQADELVADGVDAKGTPKGWIAQRLDRLWERSRQGPAALQSRQVHLYA